MFSKLWEFRTWMNRFEEMSQEVAFDEGAATFSGTSPRNAWSLCALLSVAEAYATGMPEEPPLFSGVDHESVRMVCEFILESKALDYKHGRIQADRVLEVLHYARRALDDEEGIQQAEELKQRTSPELAVQILLSRLWNVQGRYQDPRFMERTGRLIGMVEALPRTHRDRMPDECWEVADPVLAAIREHLKFPIHHLAVCVHTVTVSYRGTFRDLLRRYSLSVPAPGSPTTRLKRLLAEYEEWLPRLVLSVEELAVFDRFLDLFAKTTPELRELRRKDARYRRGNVARRLSPLEGSSVVRVGEREVVVPNVRYLERNFTDVIHFSLRDIPEYFDVRGRLQELYLRVLVETRLPAVTVIPETLYRRRKGEDVKGADLTIIEGDCLILIESKARRIVADTRLNMAPEALIENLRDAIDAVRKAPAKVVDLYAGLPEFARYQETIDRTRGRPPVIVAVMGDEVAFMGELVASLAIHYPEVPSPADIGPYSIMGIDTFERAVEVSAQEDEPLAAVLDAYIADAPSVGPGARRLDLPGKGYEPTDSFAVSFLRDALGV